MVSTVLLELRLLLLYSLPPLPFCADFSEGQAPVEAAVTCLTRLAPNFCSQCYDVYHLDHFFGTEASVIVWRQDRRYLPRKVRFSSSGLCRMSDCARTFDTSSAVCASMIRH